MYKQLLKWGHRPHFVFQPSKTGATGPCFVSAFFKTLFFGLSCVMFNTFFETKQKNARAERSGKEKECE
jgi:hypothetical protein